jgi:tetrahydromethanopterin S-methyltransferase subunit C
MILGPFINDMAGVTGAFQRLFFGAVIGLSLGILTRRITGMLILLLVGALAFLFRVAISGSLAAFYVAEPFLLTSVRALPFAVAGGVIAIGWSLSERGEPLTDT